jgi:hypothetical protein
MIADVQPSPAELPTAGAPGLTEAVDAFLKETMPAVLGTVRSDGTVQQCAVWYDYRDGSIFVNGGPGRAWAKHIERDGGRATLYFADPTNMWRFAEVRVRLADWTDDGAAEDIEYLSRKYTGREYRGRGPRRIFRFVPERVRSSFDWRR